jgi:hypothetical protein
MDTTTALALLILTRIVSGFFAQNRPPLRFSRRGASLVFGEPKSSSHAKPALKSAYHSSRLIRVDYTCLMITLRPFSPVLKAPIGAESVSLQVIAQQKSRVNRPAFALPHAGAHSCEYLARN